MNFIRPSKIRREARAAAAARAEQMSIVAVAEKHRAALQEVADTTGAVKVPNGTTKKVNRIVTEALASV